MLIEKSTPYKQHQPRNEFMKIPYGRHDIQSSDVNAVVEVLKSDFLTQGPMVPNFEEKVSRYCAAKYAIAVTSATSALHISLMALGIGKDDLVWTSPNTFLATANAALYCGAQIDFVDIDTQTYNICASELKHKLENAAKKNRLPKAVIPVHFAGQPCDMRSLHALSKEYGFYVIEDASHAMGGNYLNYKIGSCRYSDITVFSFHPVKIITTAEGGVALTNNDKLAQKLRLFRSHGVTRDPNLMSNVTPEPWHYEQVALGYNYRMNDIQAVLGANQVSRLDSYVKSRHAIADRYNSDLSHLPLRLPYQTEDGYSAYHLYVVLIEKSHDLSRKTVFEELRSRGIIVSVHYIPVHTQPYYRQLGFKIGQFPKAEAYYDKAISLTIYPTLSENDQNYIINSLKTILRK